MWRSATEQGSLCFLVGSQEAGTKQRLCYCTFGCIPMTTCWGPSLAMCRGCASPSRRGLSAPWAAPCKMLCLVCSSHEVRKWDALAASLCTASLNFFIVKSALFRGWSFTITMPEMGGEQQLLCILQVLDLNYSLSMSLNINSCRYTRWLVKTL